MFTTHTRRPRSIRSAALGIFLSTLLFTPTAIISTTTAVDAQVVDPDPTPPTAPWTPVADWPMVGLHSALDSNGRVVTYGTNGDAKQTGRFIYDIWTPSASLEAGHNTLTNTTETDLFCSLQLNRSDTGDMILFGGDNWTGASTNNRGNPDITQIDAETGLISTLPGMNRSRWYATGTTLPDGSIYVQGGLDGEDQAEHWTPNNGARLLDFSTAGIDWYYPRNFVIPDGRIFGVAPDGQMYYVSADLTDLQIVGRLPGRYRGNHGTAVMYQPGRILYIGGSTNQALTIDVTGGGQPIVLPAGQISSIRAWLNGTILPDGRVLVTGGSVKSSTQAYDDPINTYGSNHSTEIWDPQTRAWTVGPASPSQVPRLYHSTALLLPDGRVLSAGGGSPGPIDNTNAELFAPDYFFNADGSVANRPRITQVSSTDLVAGQRIRIGTASSAGVARVTLLKAGSVTHSFNMGQRFIELGFAINAGQVEAQLPDNTAVVTPGYYLLSVVDGNGVPSISKMVRVGKAGSDRLATEIDGQVARLYQAYFLRPSDQSGFDYWRGQRQLGVELQTISDAFAASAEFTGRYGTVTDVEFVDLVYRNVLGRSPDQAGRAYWVGQLNQGVTRGEVMVGFSESAEFQAQTGTDNLGNIFEPVALRKPRTADTAAQPAANPAPRQPETIGLPTDPMSLEIRRLYLAYFRRDADASGLNYWITQRQNGVSLIEVSTEMSESAEFQARYGSTSNAQFVGLVYQNVLGRNADADGQAYWVNQLQQGVSRGEVMVGFSESLEHQTRTAPRLA